MDSPARCLDLPALAAGNSARAGADLPRPHPRGRARSGAGERNLSRNRICAEARPPSRQRHSLLAPELSFLFFVRDNRSPTGRPEHFAHANGATALSAVWVATENGGSLARLLVLLGGQQERRTVSAPDLVEATVVRLGEGEVIILPRSHQLLPGRPVIGAGFRVRDPAKVGRMVAEAGIEPRAGTRAAERIVVEPRSAHGLWLQFQAGL
jgi:hypothetical protein